MATRLNQFACGAALFALAFAARAQTTSPAPKDPALAVVPAAAPEAASKPAPVTPLMPSGSGADKSSLLLVQASSPAPAGAAKTAATTTTTTTAPAGTTASPVPVSESDTTSATESGGPGVREFQGDDVGQVLRLLARQAKINMVVSEAVQGTVTMRLEDVTAMQAVSIIVKAKGLSMDKIDDVYYIKTAAERTAEPTESDSYQFSYARAKDVTPLMASQLASKDAPQIDERTNTMFFRETRSNIDNIRKMLVTIDKPTKQVMIEARLVEVTANPQQNYGINWAGTLGGQTISYGGPTSSGTSTGTTGTTQNATFTGSVSPFALGDAKNKNFFGSLGKLAFGQFAILSIPQMSATVALLNQDSDAEFLANPRIVTADNMQAKIEITRAQPVPEMTFNSQTAQSVFSGFQDKKFGNTLLVKPLINKDNFITLAVKPEISNKVGDQVFNIPNGGSVASPIIDTRSLESNVLIKSGDTLAIGGLLQDEITKSRTKVPVVGDVPVLGYLFQSRNNVRVKRNLLVFVTPTMIEQCYGTGLEDQVTGLHHTGEEYADPNGWRNNAKGAVRVLPTANRSVAADYPVPGVAPAPVGGDACRTKFKTSAKDRDF
jgi:type IV pilus secretin PilQ/predicted competence protein